PLSSAPKNTGTPGAGLAAAAACAGAALAVISVNPAAKPIAVMTSLDFATCDPPPRMRHARARATCRTQKLVRMDVSTGSLYPRRGARSLDGRQYVIDRR